MNLTSASTVIIYDPWWNPAVESQAADGPALERRIRQDNGLSELHLDGFHRHPRIILNYGCEIGLRLRQEGVDLLRPTLDDQGIYGMESVIFILPHTPDSPIHFLLSIINSKLINYLYSTKFLNVAVKAQYLKETPIPASSKADEDALSVLARRILSEKKADIAADTSALESEIDQLVYKLYNLTLEEIAIVEDSVKPKVKAKDKKSADSKVVKPSKTKKKITRKRKTTLPPSLPGWD